MANKKFIEVKNKVNYLRKLLLQGDDFSEIYNYFFEKLVELSAFMKMGKKEDFPTLEVTVKETAINIFNRLAKDDPDFNLNEFEKQFALLPTTYIKEFGFYHGAFMVTGVLGNFFYFEEEETGLLGFNLIGTQQSWFSRFSSTTMDKDSFPVYDRPKDVN